ncbi:MAG: quorum-sensing autoinducer synthase [Proteobacteria bacterium]|nr:quorum-sensing autoinducer synthase [Pseudomonadota bacterium]NCA28858.1 quorum-sensing autoinducer synthase [Pseudomonadota bacterium]
MYCDFLLKRINEFYKNVIEVRKNKKHLVIGKSVEDDSLVLTSNDYLAIANHSKILTAQEKEIKNQHNKVIMSAVFMGENTLKGVFEKEMAEYLGYESTILCQSGWAANVGLLQAIAEKDIPIYIDFFAHMSLWEGIRVANAKPVAFLHNNIAHLEKMLKKNGPGIILIDSLYSTIGDIAPIVQISKLSQQYKCIFVVDESHSVGTHGHKGSGLVRELGLTNQVDFITLSLAKTFAGRAGLIACSQRFAGYFPYISFPAIFSSALLDHEIAGLRATLEVIKESDNLREDLKIKSSYLRKELKQLGYKVESQSHIVSIESGNEERTETLRDALEERNIFGSVFCSPATPKNRALIRLSVNSKLSYDQLDYIIKCFRDIKDKNIFR